MIYLECNPDKALVKALGIRRKEIDHAGNKEEVCKKLEKSTKSKGLVDEDPLNVQPSYIGKLRSLSDEHGIKLLYDKKTRNHLLVLCPRLEEWIIKAAKESGVRIKDYGLPDNPDQLHKTINIRLKEYLNLLEDIKRKSKMIKALEILLKSKR